MDKSELGQLTIYFANPKKLAEFETTRTVWVTKDKVSDALSKMILEGKIIQNTYFDNKVYKN